MRGEYRKIRHHINQIKVHLTQANKAMQRDAAAGDVDVFLRRAKHDMDLAMRDWGTK